ncbi:hypothetical protein GCM10009836_42330 [Pseudonocardia ailaonensis]|uniref:Uncharacterized protein n=1 Tax=Pseudonocardia ailaonensis TaxID=367279 RepID=A0ABN2NCN8_9PSEU
MDAERAARRLVRATLRGTPEIILTPLAKIGTRVHALAPSTTLRLLTLVERTLPAPTGESGPPRPARTAPLRGWVRRVTELDRAAARRWHEHSDPAPDPDAGR